MKAHARIRSRGNAILLLLCTVWGAGCSGSPDDHEHEGEVHEERRDADEHVVLTEAQVQSAGITTVVVGPGRLSEALTLPGSVAPNADAVLHVTPRVPGQVRRVFKQLGETVEDGELLCVIDSVELGEAVAGYLREREMVQAAEQTLERQRELYAGRLKALQDVMEGAIAVQERIYQREEELQQKAVSTVRPLLEAERALQVARLEKDERLTELAAERDGRLLELEVALRASRIDLAAARNRLRALGLSTESLADLDETSPLLSGEYPVEAPGSGVVVDRHVSAGEFVEAGSKLYIIEDLSDVWFVASAFEEQLRAVRTGQTAYVSLDAFPGTTLDGTVSFVGYHVDPTSRSVGVRITLDNEQLESWPEELPLRPGMFGRVELETTAREAPRVLPEETLVHEEAGDFVFVRIEPLVFERRAVATRHAAGGMVEVLSGLEVGDQVVLSGTFLLKSAARKGELGGGHSH